MDSIKGHEVDTLNETMMISTIDGAKQKSNLSKEPRVMHSMLQYNYMKMIPIIRELHNSLVREEGEPDKYDEEFDITLSDDEDNFYPNLDSMDPNMLIKSNDASSPEPIEAKIGHISIRNDKKPSKKIDMRNMLGFLNQNLYHDYLNITNIMKLKRLDFRDVYSIRSPDLTITRENLIERIMILITAYF